MNIYFIMSLLFSFVYPILSRPTWHLSGEPWAEAATNYYYYAHHSTLLSQLTATDSGYYALPQRLIALAATLLYLDPAETMYFYNVSGLLWSAICTSFICHNMFRFLHHSDVTRFLLSIILAMLPDFELRTFINVTYFSWLVFVLLILYLIHHPASSPPKWVWLLVPFMAGKPVMLALIPSLMYVAVLHRMPTVKWFAAVTVIVGCAQGLRLITSRLAGVFQPTEQPDLFTVIVHTAANIVLLPLNMWGHATTFPQFVRTAVVLLAISSILYRHAAEHKAYFMSMLLLFLSSTFTVILYTVTVPQLFVTYGILNQLLPGKYTSALFFSSALMLLISLDFASRRIKLYKTLLTHTLHPWLAPSLLIGWFVSTGWFISFRDHASDYPAEATIGNSTWRANSDRLKSDSADLCVPIDPIGWVYGHGCRILSQQSNYGMARSWRTANQDGTPYIGTTNLPKLESNHHLIAVALLIRTPIQYLSDVAANLSCSDSNGNAAVFVGARSVKRGSTSLLVMESSKTIPITDSVTCVLKVDPWTEFTISEMAHTSLNRPDLILMGH